MGKSTEPPTCRFCGKAHRGTCMDHEAKGAIASQRRSGSSEVEQRPFKPTVEGSTPSPITNPRAKATRAKPRRHAKDASADGVVSRPSRRGGSPARGEKAFEPASKGSRSRGAEAKAGPAVSSPTSSKKRKPRMSKPTDKHANSDPMNGPVTKAGRGRPKTVADRKAYKAEKERARRAKKKAEQS